MRRRTLSLAAATATLAVPAAAALAAQEPAAPGPAASVLTTPLPGPYDTVAAKLRAAARPALVEDVVRLAQKKAALQGIKLRKGYRRSLSTWTTHSLRAEKRALRREIHEFRRKQRAEARAERAARRAARAVATPTRSATTTPSPATGGSTASSGLQGIAACESGGNPSAVDASGTYRGKYQFDTSTWQSVGGSGDPAAASEAEQDRRAAMLYSRAGASPWPVCGR